MKKRVYLILLNENLFHPYYFKGVIKNINTDKYEVCGVSIVEDNHKKGLLHFLNQQLYLWGPTGFLSIGFHSAFRKFFDLLNLVPLSISTVAKKNNIPVFFCKDVNGEDHLNRLKKMNIDIIISANGQIFKDELLKLPKIACINRHTALLPKYGGVLPVFWAMLYNEKEFGVSVHYMTEKIDQGDIIYQIRITLEKNHSLFFNYILGFRESIRCTIGALENMEKKKIVARFHHNEKEYFRFPSTSDMKKFHKRRKSFSLFDTISLYKI